MGAQGASVGIWLRSTTLVRPLEEELPLLIDGKVIHGLCLVRPKLQTARLLKLKAGLVRRAFGQLLGSELAPPRKRASPVQVEFTTELHCKVSQRLFDIVQQKSLGAPVTFWFELEYTLQR